MKFQTWANWIRRHPRFLTVLGAAIVFLTFMVKEGLRERAKDQLDAIESARSDFLLRLQFSNVMQRIDELQMKTADLLRNDPRSIVKHNQTAYELWRSVRDRVQSETLHSFFESSASIAQAARSNPWLTQQRRKAENEYDKLVTFQKNFDEAFSSVQLTRKEDSPNEKEKAAVANLLQQWEKTEPEMTTYALTAIVQGSLDLQQHQREYDDFTDISYFLFVVGWGVGLLGKFMEPGLKDDASEAEA